ADQQVWDGSPGPLAIFSKQIPEVVSVVRINDIYEQIIFHYGDKKITESGLAFVDSTFFSIFDFKLLKGNPAKPFPNINSVILTSSEAKKYFGDEEPVGKTLLTDQGNFTVSGIMEDFPENSSLSYNILLSMSLYAEEFKASGGNGNWKTMDEDLGNYYFNTYLQIQKGASAEGIAKKLTKIYQDKRKNE